MKKVFWIVTWLLATLSTQAQNCNFSAQITGPTVLCNLTTQTLGVMVNNQTSPSGYSYLWFLNGSSNPISNQGFLIIQSGGTYSAGTYTVHVTDSTGCTVQSSPFTVTVDSVNVLISPSGTVPICPGRTVTLVGSATGTAPFTFQWNNGSTNPTLVVQQASTYTLTVT
ncbi:MAG: hypothetical protein NZ108_05825, partial [Bacteroidia bacterium]|nr:hypothetical protein [Bacteroidia bacterium]